MVSPAIHPDLRGDTRKSGVRPPLCIDLYAGLGGWAEGFIEQGYRVIGFDNHRHVYGEQKYPGQLVIQDVLTLHGSQFKDAAVIVASPPCQAYSYRAMPWKRAKALPPPDNSLFEACFRIQREASEAAGRYIPLVVENVRGAQKWVGRAPWNFGSFYLWGDVPALMPFPRGRKSAAASPGKVWSERPDESSWSGTHGVDGRKVPGLNFHEHAKTGKPGRPFQTAAVAVIGRDDGTKQGGNWWHDPQSITRRHSSKSSARKMASALIAKIPRPLAEHIARVYWPVAQPRPTHEAEPLRRGTQEMSNGGCEGAHDTGVELGSFR